VPEREYTLVDEYETLRSSRMRTLVRVDQPLVALKDMAVASVLEAHPQCHVLPYPLHPRSELDHDFSWEALDGQLGFDEEGARFGSVLKGLQRSIYEHELAAQADPSPRAALNAYFTSFFNAWLDNQNLYGLAPKKWVVAAVTSKPSALLDAYPDGHSVRAGTTDERLARFLEIDLAPATRKQPRPARRHRSRMALDGAREYSRFCKIRVAGRIPVDQPAVLITQAPRSGGTLLLRLFDGHPEIHSIPYEFITNFSPVERPEDEEGWAALHASLVAKKYDSYVELFFRKGYSQSRIDLHGDEAKYPMLTPPLLQRRLFEACVAELGEYSWRGVTGCFFTAFFNGWLDNQNAGGEKKWVVMFTPRFVSRGDKIKQFWTMYPEGKVISVVRDPLSWYASARRWSKTGEWTEKEKAVNSWRRAVRGIMRLRSKHPDRAMVVSFNDLLTRTEPLMQRLCARLEIAFVPELLTPTFNGMPVRPNSSFASDATQVVAEPLERHRKELSKEEADYVRQRTWDLYESVLDLVEPMS
jgi:hypothetical protein